MSVRVECEQPLTYVDAHRAWEVQCNRMPQKRPPETERDRRERVELIGQQIADAIRLDGEILLTEQMQRQRWRLKER